MSLHPESAAAAFAAPVAPGSARVAVAMSGGVDSSVAAALLVEQGYDVVGVHMKLHDLPDDEKRDKSCCSLDDSLDARQACAQLGIPFYVLDYVAPFRESVIDYFEQSYLAGRTPNPCVMCNRTVKGTLLLDQVRAFGCEALATGHYAGLRRDAATGDLALVRPVDRHKDQTYFLFGTAREELGHLLYPLAEMNKDQTREAAARHGFLTWNKPDSQNVCFVPKDTRGYLRERLDQTRNPPGAFVHVDGSVLGTHEGLAYYTIGQRRGLGLSHEAPLYVVALRRDRNEVVLGPDSALFASQLQVRQVNWVSCPPLQAPVTAQVKIRSAHEATPARLTPREGGVVDVDFAEPVRAIAPGQAAVFYDGDVLLGGGWIASPQP